MHPGHPRASRSFFQERIPLVLASASPRRRDFLSSLGLSFRAASAPEEAEPLPFAGETPEAYVTRAARFKAAYVRDMEAASGVPGAATSAYIGADTTVVLDGAMLGKPRDAEEAFWFLKRLAGREHHVYSAVSVHVSSGTGAGSGEESVCVQAGVRMAAWPEHILRAYAESGEPLDKAGGYAVQGRGAFLVEAVTGSWSAVVGLPLVELITLLVRKGVLA